MFKVEIIYEDKWLIVIDKPSGLLTMSTGKANEETAYSLLMDYMKSGSSSGTSRRIFIVHRLDRDTSGLLVFAKDENTKRIMQQNWSRDVLERKYIAILEGTVTAEEGWIESWLYENSKSKKVHCIPIDPQQIDQARCGSCREAERNGWQFASSHCKTIRRGSIGNQAYSMVEFDLETGRKNQIRAHSAWIGHPVAGDSKYGAATNPFKRLALHAKNLSFIHPHTGKALTFSSKLPKKFKI